MPSDPRIRIARLDDAAAVWPLAPDFATSFTPQRDAFETTAEEWATESGAAYISLATRRARDFYAALDYEDSVTFFKKPLDRG